MLEIHGKRIILREFTKDNLYDICYIKWLRDLDVIPQIYHLKYLLSLDFSEVEAYVNSLLASKNDCFFAIYFKENDRFIGTQKIGHIDWRTGTGDVGIMIGEKEYRGLGLSTDIVNTATQYAFNYLSLRKLVGGTSSTNIPMQKCFEKLGYKKEGIIRSSLLMNGEYQDHLLYGIFKEEFKF
jgi:RimJ/RimL family protein N-acetyltransferase